MKPHYINRIGKWTAILSFLIGTFLMTTYYYTSSSVALLSGAYFIPIAVIINMTVLGRLSTKSRKDSAHYKTYLKTSKLLLWNI